MDNNVITYYTLEDAREILREEKRERLLSKAKQKLLGLLAIAVSIASPLLIQDATISVIMLPLGLYLLFTKEKLTI